MFFFFFFQNKVARSSAQAKFRIQARAMYVSVVEQKEVCAWDRKYKGQLTHTNLAIVYEKQGS